MYYYKSSSKFVEKCTTLEYFAKKEMERILFPSPDDTERVETLGNFGTLNDDAQPKISNTVYLPRILVFLMDYLAVNLDSRSNCL